MGLRGQAPREPTLITSRQARSILARINIRKQAPDNGCALLRLRDTGAVEAHITTRRLRVDCLSGKPCTAADRLGRSIAQHPSAFHETVGVHPDNGWLHHPGPAKLCKSELHSGPQMASSRSSLQLRRLQDRIGLDWL